jgi:HAD superfamily hydrolase (TIGR01509 family)
MVKAILFDLDGVLVDATEWHYEALNAALQQVSGFKIGRLEHETVFNGRPTSVKLKTLYEQGRVKNERIDEITALKQKFTLEILEKSCVYDPTKVEMLCELSKRYHLGCYSNAIRKSTETMLRNSGAFPLMEFVLSNEDVPRPKPYPDGYILAIAYFKLPPDEVVIVEDSSVGISAARASGAHVLEVLGYCDVTLQRIQDFIGTLK